MDRHLNRTPEPVPAPALRVLLLATLLWGCTSEPDSPATTDTPPAPGQGAGIREATRDPLRLVLEPGTAFSDFAAFPVGVLDAAVGNDAGLLGGFVVVQDTKDRPGEARPVSGLGIVMVPAEGPPGYEEVTVSWPEGEAASDLEAVCQIPGTDAEFMVSESGYFGTDEAGTPRYGRIFRMSLSREGGAWRGTILEYARLPEGSEGLEGMACLAEGDDLLVILGERGGPELDTNGRLLWTFLRRGGFPGRVELADLPFDGNRTLSLPRDITGLYVDGNGLLWVSSAEDRGDYGPFRSAVQLAGTVRMDRVRPLELLPEPIPVFYSAAMKIEGISVGLVPGIPMSVVTENEALGGSWFPLDLREAVEGAPR